MYCCFVHGIVFQIAGEGTAVEIDAGLNDENDGDEMTDGDPFLVDYSNCRAVHCLREAEADLFVAAAP